MRVTFDSNAWQKVVVPNLARKTSLYDAFADIHEALRTKEIQGFICETVGTLEAIRRRVRKAYFTSIKPAVKVQSDAKGDQILVNINIGPNHDQHPGLPHILRERLEFAFNLGIRLMRAPRIGIPLPDLFLDLSVFAEDVDVAISAARDNRWGDVVSAIEERGVGSGALRLQQGRFKAMGETEFARAVAEWADGDSVAAHVAYGNDVFCTEDQGKTFGSASILDVANRKWVTATYNVIFATIRELATEILLGQFKNT
jgi:hypothetical protein